MKHQALIVFLGLLVVAPAAYAVPLSRDQVPEPLGLGPTGYCEVTKISSARWCRTRRMIIAACGRRASL
jgi:hypothetical protein